MGVAKLAMGWLLFPIALLYDGITRLRNHLYNIGYKRSFVFDLPVISVGNLSVGGTGKTPMVEYLIRLCKANYHVAVLSRGYGRKTRGFRLAGHADHSATIGDEPYQYYLKFNPEVTVAVGEERVLAIPEILFHSPDTQMILLDDAYQHRAVSPHLNILLTEYNKPFFEDFLLPTGRLRESRTGAQRANVVVVTKCPGNIMPSTMKLVMETIRQYSKEDVPVFFTYIQYLKPKAVYNELANFQRRVVLFSGISNSTHLEKYAQQEFTLIRHLRYNDHHAYTAEDIEMIISVYQQEKPDGACILTTEKDMVKLMTEPMRVLLQDLPVFYLPIETAFLQNQDQFDQIILNSLEKN